MRDYADVYALTAEQLAGLTSTLGAQRRQGDRQRRFGEKNAAKVVAQIERSRSERALAADLRARHPPRRRARARRCWPRAFGSIDALCGATVEQLQPTPEIGPVLAESVRELARRAAQPRAGRPAARRRRPHGGAARTSGGASPAPRPADRQDLRPHRHADVDDARGGRRPRIERLGGKVAGSVSKKTTAVIVGADAGQQGREGARRSACRCSTRPPFWTLDRP